MTKEPSYSLSTAWNYRRHASSRTMAKEIRSLGFRSCELNFSLTEKQVRDFVKLRRARFINISTTHNYCPLPDGVDPKNASPEYYSLSALDDKERSLAVHFTKKSMDYAKELCANALILHLGRVDMNDRTMDLFCCTTKARFEDQKKALLEERDRLAGPYLKQAMQSLTELLAHANSINLNIALENRYYIKELPSLEEFRHIFKEFPSEEHLFYWHDVGHAQIYENLGILRHEDYLESCSKRLLGLHLHDIILFDDHRAPGCGEFDFTRLKAYINNDTIRVIEAHRKSTAEDVKRSLKLMKRLL